MIIQQTAAYSINFFERKKRRRNYFKWKKLVKNTAFKIFIQRQKPSGQQ